MGREIVWRIIGPHRDLQWGTTQVAVMGLVEQAGGWELAARREARAAPANRPTRSAWRPEDEPRTQLTI